MKTIISLSAVKIPSAEDIVDGLRRCGIHQHQINNDVTVAGGKATFSIECDKPMYLESLSDIEEYVDNVSDVLIKPKGHNLEITIIFLK